MARKSNNTGLLAATGLLLGGFLLYYLKDGAGSERNAALLPDEIEDNLDRVVDELNRLFGRRWVDRGIAALEKSLSAILPTPVVALVSVVHETEKWAERQRTMGRPVSGLQKRRFAAARYAQS